MTSSATRQIAKSIEFGADDEAALLPVAVEGARQGPSDILRITPGAELAHRNGLPSAPVGALLARVLEMERQPPLPAAGPQQTRTAAAMLDSVVPQLPRRHDGGVRVLKARRSREIADSLANRSDHVKAG
jgi:hypothetical protein